MRKLGIALWPAIAITTASIYAQTVTTTGGTTNTVPVFTGSTTIGNSPITQSGNTVAVATTVLPIGYVDVRANINGQIGALCNGSTDDTVAIQNAINYAVANNLSVRIPATGSACVVSRLNLTNLNNKIRIVGDAGPISFQSIISCNESTSNTGVCIDLTGSQYVDIENLRIQYGTPPLAVIRMGNLLEGMETTGTARL